MTFDYTKYNDILKDMASSDLDLFDSINKSIHKNYKDFHDFVTAAVYNFQNDMASGNPLTVSEQLGQFFMEIGIRYGYDMALEEVNNQLATPPKSANPPVSDEYAEQKKFVSDLLNELKAQGFEVEAKMYKVDNGVVTEL